MRKNWTSLQGQKKKGLQQMQEDDRHDGGFGSERPTAGCTSLMLSLLPLSELAVKVDKCGRRELGVFP